MTGSGSTSQDGFSILEMIVAMTILALVLGIASQTIVLAARSISVARQQVEDARRLREIMATYDAGRYQSGDANQTTPTGWVLKTSRIDVSGMKMTALVIERGDLAGGGSFLTFLPETRSNGQ